MQVKLLRYQVTGQRQPTANMFAGMVGSIGGMVSSKHTLSSLFHRLALVQLLTVPLVTVSVLCHCLRQTKKCWYVPLKLGAY